MTEPISIELSGRDCSSLQLSFERTLDRWAHQWYSTVQGQPQLWMQSVEGSSEQRWPPSPPLQELTQHMTTSGNSVLGVGMAGRSHWSAAFSIEQASDGADWVKSDLACLPKETLSDPASRPSLGSTYEFSGDCEIRSFNQTRIELGVSADCRIVLEALQSEDCATEFRLSERKLTILPVQISKSPARSSRWGFLVKCMA